VDAQIIQVLYEILKELKLKNLVVNINSIGCSQCRPYYKKLLASYFRNRESSLCPDCRRRLHENVLRILDCKDDRCQTMKQGAPQTLDHLCDECKAHFKEVLEFLDEINIPYNLDPYLVRGLDYYTRTVFEIFSQKDQGKQLALGGGGRYDKLVKVTGGKDTPACGMAGGVERIISLMKSQEVELPAKDKPVIFLAQLGALAKKKTLRLLGEFRKAKIKTAESFGKDSLKVQLSRANRLGVRYSLIIGQKEAIDGEVIVRDMAKGKQEIVKIEKVVVRVKEMLKKK
ncbi:MAG TPA: histidine--tRNA ligase, partial [Candidatus Parcubacteria bacterium]|nr:histidine--tRNA ligase [Candidatus Parcubacteria bacterium]